jgi:hypothetical protein
MAKKRKKTAKKAAKKKPSGVAATSVDTDAELQAAAVVTWAAEGVLGAVEYRDFDIRYFVSQVAVTVGEPAPRERTTGEENARRLLLRCRRQFIEADYDEMPFLRTVGRVVEVLTVRRRQIRGKDSCSAGDVFRVFLTEIPQHSPYDREDYRLARPTARGNQFDLSRDPGKTMFSGRLKDLKKDGWLTAASKTRNDSDRGYRLSADGRWLFDGWPEVDGLHDAPPATE